MQKRSSSFFLVLLFPFLSFAQNAPTEAPELLQVGSSDHESEEESEKEDLDMNDDSSSSDV